MKLLFSEAHSDYSHYLYPYVIWAVPEAGETPADLFNYGFLPASLRLDRFYLCRQIRVNLARFNPSSENRRILRKGDGITCQLVSRPQFNYTPERRAAFKAYADVRFGQDIMSFERLDRLFASPVISHVLVFADAKSGTEVGVATLYVEDNPGSASSETGGGKSLAYYYYGFYDLNYGNPNLGMFMMTSAVAMFAERGYQHIYLGTCYSQRALYKTQFAGVEFFNGVRWSSDMDELKFMLKRDKAEPHKHLLESGEFLVTYYAGDLKPLAEASPFGTPRPN